MSLKPSTIAIHNGLNEDTQFGCVVPLFTCRALITSQDSMSREFMIIHVEEIQDVILCKEPSHSLKAVVVR